MNKDKMLKISRDLINSFIEKNDVTLGIEHYFMFSITKFLLTKEQIIKKNNSNKKIEFDVTSEYLSTILTQYHEISKTLYYRVDGVRTFDEVDDSVSLTNLNEEMSNVPKLIRLIKESVWCIDKIRDSLAHGKYDFNIQEHKIIINNEYDTFDQNGKIIHHTFKCEIPPEILTILGKTYRNTYNKYEDKDLTLEYQKRHSGINNILKNKYSLTPKENNSINTIKKPPRKSLSVISEEIYIHNAGVTKVAETVKALGLKGEKNDIFTSLLYNHLLLLLSDETREYNYDELLLLNQNYTFLESKDSSNKEEDITNTKGPIKRAIKKFHKQYKKLNEFEKSKRCKELFKSMYLSLKEQFGIRNKNVIKRIRNSIMHGNIEIDTANGVIKLFDRTDNTADSKVNQFECITDNYGLLSLIDELENKKTYTLQMFIIEIDKLLTSFGLDNNYIREKITEILLCLKTIDRNINLNTSMDDIMTKLNENDKLDDLKEQRKQLLNVIRNIKDKKEQEESMTL